MEPLTWLSLIVDSGTVVGWSVRGTRALSDRYGENLREWAAQVRADCHLSDAALAESLKDAAVAEVASIVVPAAAVSASSDKRQLLSLALVRAIAGRPDDAEVDPRPLYARAVAAIDPIHVEVLVELRKPRPTAGDQVEVGNMPTEDLLRALPHLEPIHEPVLATLQREGLLIDTGSTYYDGGAYSRWTVSGFGHQLISWLLDPGGPSQGKPASP